IEGSIKPDSGAVAIQKGIRSAYLPQVVPDEIPGTVFDVVAGGIQEHWDLVTRYHSVSARLSQENTPVLHDELDRIHDELEAKGGWDRLQKVSKVISLLGLDPERVFNTLSAGLKRQTLLGKALAGEPDILLLDEPTNHMDIDSIKRLEELLMRFAGALILVTHDRMFLQRIATRIMEIDRGSLFDLSCDYETFLVRRSAARKVEETENALFDKKLQKEEQWIRQGVKARRTRNEGRVRELEKLREIRRSRRERPGTVKIEVQKAGRSGKLVTEVEDVSYDYGGTPIISNLFTTILKGDRIGILGPNGCGKTTLLRILLGELKPVTGSVRLGTNLQICYFDQLRELLDDNKTVLENVVEGTDIITINGKDRHIMGYLQDFLFTPEQAYSYVSVLSGGERNRLMLARLFTRPSNLLVLDEPTNDLDIETISILEDFLMKYTGTILLVSHDRAFINNIVTSTLVFEGNAVVKEYVGGYDDWLSQRQQEAKPANATVSKKNVPPAKTHRAKTKISYQQQKELGLLPDTIELLETEQKALSQAMGEPGLYKKDKSEILAIQDRLESVKKQLTEAYARWQELEHLSG
ncbi:MAG: ATP-binding cassette domain-containing protein, partial [Chloroflexi bacterium]|nr:ATP-binding cassette domain-containing protein [Chloroflexota bacterium]